MYQNKLTVSSSIDEVKISIAGSHVDSKSVITVGGNRLVNEPILGPCLMRHRRDDAAWSSNLGKVAKILSEKITSLEFRRLRIVVTLPGVHENDEREDVARHLQQWFKASEVAVIDDTLAAALPWSGDTLIVSAIADYGASVGIVKNQSLIRKIDGIGPLFGDFGSAFRIASVYLSLLSRKTDAGIDCPLYPLVKDNFDGMSLIQFSNIMLSAYPDDWAQEISRIGFQILEAGDNRQICKDTRKVARRVIRKAARQFARSSHIAIEHAKQYTASPIIVVSGEVFKRSRYFTKFIKHEIQRYGITRVIESQIDVSVAALKFDFSQ